MPRGSTSHTPGATPARVCGRSRWAGEARHVGGPAFSRAPGADSRLKENAHRRTGCPPDRCSLTPLV